MPKIYVSASSAFLQNKTEFKIKPMVGREALMIKLYHKSGQFEAYLEFSPKSALAFSKTLERAAYRHIKLVSEL